MACDGRDGADALRTLCEIGECGVPQVSEREVSSALLANDLGGGFAEGPAVVIPAEDQTVLGRDPFERLPSQRRELERPRLAFFVDLRGYPDLIVAELVVLRHAELLHHLASEPILGGQCHERADRTPLAFAVRRKQTKNREHLRPIDFRNLATGDRPHAADLLRKRWHVDAVDVVPTLHARPLHEANENRPILAYRLAFDLSKSCLVEVLDACRREVLDVWESREQLHAPRELATIPIALADDRWLDSGEPLRDDRRELAAPGRIYSTPTGDSLGVELRSDSSSLRWISRARRERDGFTRVPEPADEESIPFVWREAEASTSFSNH